MVEAAPVSADSELQSIKETILQTSDPWDADPSLDIVQFEPPPPKVHDDEDELSSKYPAPQPSKFKMSAAVAEPNLTRENYKERLHQLLFIEEMSQYQVGWMAHTLVIVRFPLARRWRGWPLVSACSSPSTT